MFKCFMILYWLHIVFARCDWLEEAFVFAVGSSLWTRGCRCITNRATHTGSNRETKMDIWQNVFPISAFIGEIKISIKHYNGTIKMNNRSVEKSELQSHLLQLWSPFKPSRFDNSWINIIFYSTHYQHIHMSPIVLHINYFWLILEVIGSTF